MNPLLPLRDAWFFFTRHLTTLVPLCLPWIFLESLLQQQIDEAVGPQQMGAWSLVAGLLFYPLYTAALILFMDARGATSGLASASCGAPRCACGQPSRYSRR